MVDPKLIATMLKLALDTQQVKPEEVMAILQRKQQGREEDKNTETVDSEVLDSGKPSYDDTKNDEGSVLETAFKELDVEDAIEEAKEQNKYNLGGNEQATLYSGSTNTSIQKAASVLDELRKKLCQPKEKLVVRFK